MRAQGWLPVHAAQAESRVWRPCCSSPLGHSNVPHLPPGPGHLHKVNDLLPPQHPHCTRCSPPPPIQALPCRGLDIYKVNDLLSAKGWHLNALQHPAALHLCITAAHSLPIVELLLRDLKEAVEACQQVGGALVCLRVIMSLLSCRCRHRYCWGERRRPACRWALAPTAVAAPLPRPPSQDPKAGGDGMAPLYGMAAAVPDRRVVGTFLTAYQDALLEGV